MKFHYHYKFSFNYGSKALLLIRNNAWIIRNVENLPINIDKTFKSRDIEFFKEI